MFSLRVQETRKGRVVAACDLDLLGETFTEGDVTLHVDEAFYGGDEVELAAVVDALDRYHTANLVGNELIDGLMEAGLVQEEEPEQVDGVRHVQLFRV